MEDSEGIKNLANTRCWPFLLRSEVRSMLRSTEKRRGLGRGASLIYELSNAYAAGSSSGAASGSPSTGIAGVIGCSSVSSGGIAGIWLLSPMMVKMKSSLFERNGSSELGWQ